jgi:catechol 2,3-dioxygenase-like lactoylglutathione lyase family enzyme
VNFTSFAVATSSLGYWIERLIARGVAFTGPTTRFDERVLSLRDADGLNLEIVASASADRRPSFEHADVPAEHAIRGLHAATIWVNDAGPTAAVLATLGFRRVATEEKVHRYEAGVGGSGTYVDLRAAGDFWKGALGVGVVHHVAFRVESDESEAALAADVRRAGLSTTPAQDRVYFHSVYFREPGGVLFELATDGPGFAVDEAIESLGEALQLPPWLEAQRARLEAALPVVHPPVYPPERASFGAESA